MQPPVPMILILIAFITGNSSLEPLIEGLCAQIHVNLRWRVFGRNRTGDLTDYYSSWVPRSPPLSYGDRWITEYPLGPSRLSIRNPSDHCRRLSFPQDHNHAYPKVRSWIPPKHAIALFPVFRSPRCTPKWVRRRSTALTAKVNSLAHCLNAERAANVGKILGSVAAKLLCSPVNKSCSSDGPSFDGCNMNGGDASPPRARAMKSNRYWFCLRRSTRAAAMSRS